jgi:hypothetical protein
VNEQMVERSVEKGIGCGRRKERKERKERVQKE